MAMSASNNLAMHTEDSNLLADQQQKSPHEFFAMKLEIFLAMLMLAAVLFGAKAMADIFIGTYIPDT